MRAERQHQQRVEAEPLEQRRLRRVGTRIGPPHDARLADLDHFLCQRVVGDEEELERMLAAVAPVAAQLDEQIADHARDGRERRVEQLDQLAARDVQDARDRLLGRDLLQ